ncbi:MAG: NAD(P)H-hydrate dehydratase [ANME-2 cluster archaeon]|jgi:hydroxyethylthiazole kinase-like uncharacterized protein yjeF|nr:NAD(P)H-hydrate dehydratase [ANME-2 cluster archaeon]
MKTITSRRMDALDTNCEYLGLSRLQLMENAGSAVAAEVMNLPTRERVLLVAGRGNNGGDAFVAARHLTGYEVKVLLLGKSGDVKTPEAARNLSILKSTGIPVIEVTDVSGLDPAYFSDCDVIVDAIFGTGIKGPIREPETTVIDMINGSDAKVVSVDVPSGMDPDGGEFEKAVKSDVTVTFHLPKPGLLEKVAKDYIKEIAVADIGIPPEAEIMVGPGDLKLVTGRRPDSHKGEGGRVLIIGGGAYTGAPALSGMAALRTGADIVTVAVPKSVAGIVASFSPNLIVRKLSKKRLHRQDIPVLEELIQAHDVVVIGMGLGRDDETLSAVREILPLCNRVVVDADGLAALETPLSQYGCEMIITPHAGEFKALGGADVPGDLDRRVGMVNRFSADNGAVVLLKGPEDIISDGQGARVNRTGNPGMTVGGTGDVLAGITGALFARHNAIEAAAAAAYICGRAGDMVYEELGTGLLATDVIDNIPAAMKI